MHIDWNRTQQVANYRMARKTLRTVAIGSLIWGGIAVLLGGLSPLDPVCLTLGLVLLGTGTWNLTRPRPAGIVIDGITLCVIGVYNLSSAFLGGAGAGLWVKLGIFQLIWGGQEIFRFGAFREALAFEPQDTELRQLDETIRAIEKGKHKGEPDLIEFTTSGLQAKVWRARLTDEGAVLVKRGSHETFLLRRHEMEIQPGGKVLVGKNLKATFAISGKTHKGTISPEGLERFQEWKLGVVKPAAIAA